MGKITDEVLIEFLKELRDAFYSGESLTPEEMRALEPFLSGKVVYIEDVLKGPSRRERVRRAYLIRRKRLKPSPS